MSDRKDDWMIQQLKNDIYDDLIKYIDGQLYNHRKEKAGLVSTQNVLLNQILKMLREWKDEKEGN